MAKGDDIQERLIDFAVRVMRVCGRLPRSRAGRHVADQLLRSGTAPAAQYAEARGAESAQDFLHKLKICLKELNETAVWLRITVKSDLMPAALLDSLVQECDELTRVIGASIRTVKASGAAPHLHEQSSPYPDPD